MAHHPIPEGYGPPRPRTYPGGTPVHQFPTAPQQYAPVASIHHARRDDTVKDPIVITEGQAVLYAGAFLVTFSAAMTCGVAAFAMWAAMR